VLLLDHGVLAWWSCRSAWVVWSSLAVGMTGGNRLGWSGEVLRSGLSAFSRPTDCDSHRSGLRQSLSRWAVTVVEIGLDSR